MKRRKTVISVLLLIGMLALNACDGDEAVSLSSEDETTEDIASFDIPVDTSYPTVPDESIEAGQGVYKVAGFTVSLPSSFVQRQVNGFALFASEGEENAAVLYVESFIELEAVDVDSSITVEEYSKRVLEKGGLQASVTAEGGRAFFEYVKEIENAKYHYFAYVYKGKDAFYMLQFSCNDNSAAEKASYFRQIADSAIVD